MPTSEMVKAYKRYRQAQRAYKDAVRNGGYIGGWRVDLRELHDELKDAEKRFLAAKQAFDASRK